MRLILLAAGQGLQLDGVNKILLTDPKDGKCLLTKYIEYFDGLQVTVVTGYKAVNVMQRYPMLDYIYNPDWKLTNNSYSLGLALTDEPSIIMSSDLFFDKEVADRVLSGPANCVLTEDRPNRILSALNCSVVDGVIKDIYQGHIKSNSDPEAIGIYKVSEPLILKKWKRNCLEYKNLFIGQNLPLQEDVSIQSLNKGNLRFDEVNSPIDYMRVMNSLKES